MSQEQKETLGKNTSLTKAFQILDYFLNHSSVAVTITTLSEELGLNFTTCYRLAEFLSQNGYLFKNHQTKQYSLGWKFMMYSNTELQMKETIFNDIAWPYLTKLRDTFDENASIYIQINQERKCLLRLEGQQEIRNVVKQGSVREITTGSPGKVLLAYLPESEWGVYINVTDEIRNLFYKIRERGYHTTTGERTAGVSSISAPVFGFDGKILGALSISGPTFRFNNSQFDMKINMVKQYAREMSEEILREYKGSSL